MSGLLETVRGRRSVRTFDGRALTDEDRRAIEAFLPTITDPYGIPVTFILVAVIFIGQQVVQGLFVRDSISNLSHIAGGAVGSAAGYFLNRKSGL